MLEKGMVVQENLEIIGFLINAIYHHNLDK